MRPLASWLERFRRPAAVPEAAGESVAAELMPVFAALDEIEEAATRVRTEAEAEARTRIEAAERAADRVVDAARARAPAERARAEAARLAELEDAARRMEEEAQIEAEAVLVRGRGRIPALVEQVVASVTEDVR